MRITERRGPRDIQCDFFDLRHRKLFAATVTLQCEGKDPDLLTVHDTLNHDAELEVVGGITYLASLEDGIPTAGDILHVARRLREMATFPA